MPQHNFVLFGVDGISINIQHFQKVTGWLSFFFSRSTFLHFTYPRMVFKPADKSLFPAKILMLAASGYSLERGGAFSAASL
jgi:hypothetical protein